MYNDIYMCDKEVRTNFKKYMWVQFWCWYKFGGGGGGGEFFLFLQQNRNSYLGKFCCIRLDNVLSV